MKPKTKHITITYDEWKTETLMSIHNHTLNPSYYEQLLKLIKDFTNNQTLSPPLTERGPDFVDSYSPLIIEAILSQDHLSSTSRSQYLAILKQYVSLLSVLILSEYSNFIEAASQIIKNPRSPFYCIVTHSMLQLSPTTSAYEEILMTFVNSNVLDNTILIINTMQTIPFPKIRQITSIFSSCSAFFEPLKMQSLIRMILNKVFEFIQTQKLREINEKEIDSAINSLLTLDRSETIQREIYSKYIKFLMDLINVDNLSKQFSALGLIKKSLKKSRDVVSRFLIQYKFVDYFLQKGIHSELITDFCEVYSDLIQFSYDSEQLKKIWEMALQQGSNDKYINGLYKIITNMPSLNPFFLIIIEGDQIPDSILPFLRKISFKCPSNIKPQIFNKLYNLYLEKSERRSQSLISTLDMYIEKSDKNFCKNLQKKCLKNIQNNENIDLSINLLNNSFVKLKQKKANKFFNLIIKNIENINTDNDNDILNVLIKILRSFKNELSKEDFDKIQILMKKMITNHKINEVCQFYRELFDQKSTPNNLLSNEMTLQIFDDLCSLNYNEGIFSLIQELYYQINFKNKTNYGIKSLWKLLKNTNDSLDVINYMIRLYINSNQINDFIKECSEDFNNRNLLLAINQLIHYVEDGSLNPKPKNKFYFENEYYLIHLYGSFEMELKVINDISFHGFIRQVSELMNINEYSLEFYVGDDIIYQDNFNLSPDMNIRVNIIDTKPKDNNLTKIIPTEILFNNYQEQLYDIMIENNELSEFVLDILNQMPTLKSQYDKLNEYEWDEFMCIDSPFLFLYRMNFICNLFLKNQNDFIKTFYNTNGLIIFLNILINVSQSIFDIDKIILLIKMEQFLLSKIPSKEIKKETFDQFDELIPTLLQWIQQVANDSNNEEIDDDNKQKNINLCNELITFSFNFKDKIIEYKEEFNDLIKATIFHNSLEIRTKICDILTKKQEKLLISLIPLAKSSKSEQFFKVFIKIIKKTKNSQTIWDISVKSLYKYYLMPKDDNIIKILTFKTPSLIYLHGLINILNLLIDKMNGKIPKIKKLFEFLINDILFNSYKYYQPTKDLFNLLIKLINIKPKLSKILNPKLATIQKFHIEKDNIELSLPKHLRGIRNLGSTCYINSTIQQLFNIDEFKNRILHSNFEEKDWFYEFQYIIAKLLLFPSKYIDISNFTTKWHGYDGEIINPHVQQDSVEFLQLLLDRLETKFEFIKDLFTGIIKHTIVGVNEQFETITKETFNIFPVEVKNHNCLEDSLKFFLEPDHFDYIIENKKNKKIEALRYHKIEKAPKILIIHLKRFEFNLSTNVREKINDYFIFPMEFKLNNLMDNTQNDTIYDLYGVVQHTGTAQGGHYFSDVRNDNLNQWFCCNDTNVKRINGKKLPKEAAGGMKYVNMIEDYSGKSEKRKIENSCNAYLLFYKLRNTNDEENNEIDINPKILDRLINEIKEAILKQISSQPEFLDLALMNSNEDGSSSEFIYSHLINQIRTTNFDVANKALEKCLQFLDNNKFSSFILSKENDFLEFIIFNKNVKSKEIYKSLIFKAFENADGKTIDKFYQFISDFLLINSNILLENFHSIPDIFDIFEKIIPKIQNIESFVSIFMNFITNQLTEYSESHKNENIYQKIDLKPMFNILNSIKFNESALETYNSFIFKDKSLIQLINVNTYFDSLSLLISKLLNKDSTKDFINYIKNNFIDISIPTLSKFFIICLLKEDSNLINEFLDVMNSFKEKKYSMFFNTLSDMNPTKYTKVFIKNSFNWIQRFLLSIEKTERESFQCYLYDLFPMFPRNVNLQQENNNLPNEDLHLLFNNLINLYQINVKISEYITKNDKKYTVENYTTKTYFDTLKWVTLSGNYKDELNEKNSIFISSIKNYLMLPVIEKYPLNHLIDFFYDVYKEQFFDVIPLTKVISIYEKGKPSLQTSLRFLSLNFPNDTISLFIKSNFFNTIIENGLIEPYYQQIKTFIINVIETKPDNIKKILQQLWSERSLNHNISTNNINFYDLTSYLIINNQQALTYFENEILPIFAFRFCRKPNLFIAKILSDFNNSYLNKNKNKTNIFGTSKSKNLFKKYQNEFFNPKQVLILITKQTNGTHYLSAYYDLLESFVLLNNSFINVIYEFLYNKNKSIIEKLFPKSEASKFICFICMNYDNKEKSISLLLKNFMNIPTSDYKSITYFCDAINKLIPKDNFELNNQIEMMLKNNLMTSTDLRVFNDTVKNEILERCSPNTLIALLDKIQRLIGNTIRNAIVDPTKEKLIDVSNAIDNGYKFMMQIAALVEMKMPAINVPKTELDTLQGLYESFELSDCIEKLFEIF